MILNLFDKEDITSEIEELIKLYKDLGIEETVAAMRTDGIADAKIRATLESQKYADAEIEQALATKSSSTAIATDTIATKTNTRFKKLGTIATTAFNAALTGLIGIGITLIGTKLISFFDELIVTQKELAEAAEESKNKIDELNDSFVNQKKTIKEYSNEYATLAQGVNLLTNKNISLSTDDYERFLELTNILADTFPTLKTNIDENGNAILNLDGNVDTIVSSLNDLITVEQNLANQEIAKNIPKIYESYQSTIEETNNKIDDEIDKQEKLKKARDLLLEYTGKPILDPQINKDYQNALRLFDVDASDFNGGPNGYQPRNLTTDKQIIDKYNQLFTTSQQSIQNYETKLKTELSKLNQYIATYLSTDFDFTELEDGLKSGIVQLFQNFDYNSLPDNIDSSDYNEVYYYLKSIYIEPINTISEEIKGKLNNIFNKPTDITNKEYINLVNEIQTYFDTNNIKINLDFIVEDEKELQTRLQNAITNITGKNLDQSQILESFTSGMDSSQVETFIKIMGQVKSSVDPAREAIELYNNAIAKSKEYDDIDVESIVDGLKEIRTAYTTVYDAIEEYKESKHLTLETIESLLLLDEKYLQYLYDENGQLTLNTEAYNALTQAKLNELYTGIISDAMQTLNALESEADAAHYLKLKNIELKDANWDLAESELAVWEATLLSKKAKGEKTSIQEQAFNEVLTDLKNRIGLLNEAKKGMNFSDFYTGSSSKKSTKEAFSKEFDWIENSVDNVSKAIENLNDKLSNTSSFKERLSLYDDLIEKDQTLINTTKKAANAYEKEWEKASNKIGDKYKNKIISGDVFNIETITDEKLAENIENAQGLYDKWQSMVDKYNNSINQLAEDKLSKIQVKLELEEIKLDIHTIDNQDDLSSKVKNKYIEEEEKIKKNILKYNLQLAKTEEEKTLLQKEYTEYLKENQELIYQNNKQERDNKISYYDTRIQDIQNAIDLTENKGGQGTEKQYSQMNNYIEKQKELERKNYEKALAMRNKYDYGTEKWDEYNQEVQTAQDNLYALTNAQIENNRAILQLPVKKIEEANEKLQEQLDIISSYKEKVETAISAASNIVQNQIDTLNDEKNATSEFWDSQIESINKQKDALTKANDEIKNQLALEKAQYEFEKAKNQKTTKIYREGVGFVYEADQESIKDAEEELDNQEYNSAIYKLEVNLDTLEKSKEEAIKAIDNQINSLELYKERIDSITEGYQKMLDLQQLISLFDKDAVNKIENGDLSIINDMTDKYNGLASQETSLQLQIEANEKAIEQIEIYAEKWNGSSQTIILAKQNIEKVISDNTKEIASIQKRVEAVSTINDAWESTKTKLEEELGFIQNNQIVAKDEEASVLEERLNNIKSFATKASDYLNKITTALSNAENKQEELNKIANQNNKNSKDGKVLSIETMGEKHSGLETGFVGESNNGNNKDRFKYIALNELKPDEIPYVLLKNEAVLSESQQKNVLDNMRNSFISGIDIGHSNFIPIHDKTNTVEKNIEFNGDIILNGVQDTNTLAKKIKNEFLIRLDQEFYK